MSSKCRWLLLLAVCTPGCTAPSGAGAGATPAAPTSANVGSTTVVALQPASQPPCSIWQFLGVPGAAKGVCKIATCIESRLGTLFPGLEPTPALLPISDPANLQSTNPAVASAASVKADEDAAPQKIKAINYLATIGCGGCYPEVQDALLAALDDCTEAVRFAAVSALRSTACGHCKVCRKKACCSPKVMEKLHKVAYDVDDEGCFKEPSPRVRRMARLAMAACGCAIPPPANAAAPQEGPAEAPAPAQPAEAVPNKTAYVSPIDRLAVVRAAAPPATAEPIAMVPNGRAVSAVQPPAVQPPSAPPPVAPLAVAPTVVALPPTSPAEISQPNVPQSPEPSPVVHTAVVQGRGVATSPAIGSAAPVQPPANTAAADGPPVAVAVGIEPIAPSNAASPAVGGPAVPTGTPAVATRAPASAAASTPAVENRPANRMKIFANPFVTAQTAAAKKTIKLTSAEQSVDARGPQTGSGVQQANWNTEVAQPPQLPDEQLRAYFNEHRARYQGPPEVRWEWIHVQFDSFSSKVDAYAAAATLRQAAVAGEMAAALAKYPKTVVRPFDWTAIDQVPSRSISRALRQLQPGEVSVMMENAIGVDVVRAIEKRWRPLEFEQVKELVRRDMLNEARPAVNRPPAASR